MALALVETSLDQPSDEDALVSEFLAGCSVATARAYARDLANLRCHLVARSIGLLGARRSDLAAWVRDQEAAGTAAATIRRRIAAAAGLYRHLVFEGGLAVSPAAGLRRPAGLGGPRLGLAAEDLARLRSAARSVGDTAALLVDLLLVEGLRVSEACGADDTDVVSEAGTRALRVRRKGGRVETVGLVNEVAGLVDKLVAIQGPGPLLRGRDGGRLARQVAWRWVCRLAELAGIEGRTFPHLLRHSHVTQAISAGVPLAVVALGVGHRDVRTTVSYAKGLARCQAAAATAVADRVREAGAR